MTSMLVDCRRHLHKMPMSNVLDLAKASDSTWLPGLILKLREIGVDDSCLMRLTNFLQSRSFRVLIGQTASEPRDLLAGVPQGSPLSPTLFNIMLYDFPKPQLPVKALLYADDIETHVSTNSYRDAEDKLQPYLDKIVRWCSKWKLKLSYENSSSCRSSTRQDRHLNHYCS